MVAIETNQTEEKLKEKILTFAGKMKNREIVIIGNDNINVDVFLSGILLSKLFNYMEVKNHFYILEPVVEDNETYRIVKELFEIDMKKWVKTEMDDNMQLFLVDHFETLHKGKVVGCIDPHQTSKQVKLDFVYRKKSCATAYMVYELMRLVGYQPSKEEIKMIIVAMMINTTSFKSSKTIQKEAEAAKQLTEEYGLDYDSLIKYCLCITPIKDMKIKEIVSNGQKYYNYAGNKVGSSYLKL